jgi:hypothetical protein
MRTRHLLLLADQGQPGHDVRIVDRQVEGDMGHAAGRYPERLCVRVISPWRDDPCTERWVVGC